MVSSFFISYEGLLLVRKGVRIVSDIIKHQTDFVVSIVVIQDLTILGLSVITL